MDVRYALAMLWQNDSKRIRPLRLQFLAQTKSCNRSNTTSLFSFTHLFVGTCSHNFSPAVDFHRHHDLSLSFYSNSSSKRHTTEPFRSFTRLHPKLSPSDNKFHETIIMTPSFLLSSCTLLVLSSFIPLALAQTPLGLGQLVWSEEFNDNGALDESHWSYDIGNGNWGWGNGEVQDYTTSNVQVSGGNAVITVNEDSSNQFTSARIRTNGMYMILLSLLCIMTYH